MFKFNKKVDKEVDQELEEGELSDSDVDVVNNATPLTIQPKNKVQTHLNQQSQSQEYVFETVAGPPSPQRKKERKQLKVLQKARDSSERRLGSSRSPESINYRPSQIPNQSYYPYPPANFPPYTNTDPRSYQYMMPTSQHSTMRYPHGNTHVELQWAKPQYPPYNYQAYAGPNQANLQNNSLQNVNGNYSGSMQNMKHMGTNQPIHKNNISCDYGSQYTQKTYCSPNEPKKYTPSQTQSNSYNFRTETLQQKKKVLDQQKRERKKVKEQKLKKRYDQIKLKIDEYLKVHQDEKNISCKKQNVKQILYIIKGVIMNEDPENMKLGDNTIERIDEIGAEDQRLKAIVTEILKNLGAKKVIQKLKERQIEKILVGPDNLKKCKQMVKQIDKSRDPRILL